MPSPPPDPPLVLAATVARQDRRTLESQLKEAGFEVRPVDAASDAAAEAAGHGGPCVLVIDAGLLHMPHDAQWRLLRSLHPGLGMVVRCLIPRRPGVREEDGHTWLVHPDHTRGLLRAVRGLTRRARAG